MTDKEIDNIANVRNQLYEQMTMLMEAAHQVGYAVIDEMLDLCQYEYDRLKEKK